MGLDNLLMCVENWKDVSVSGLTSRCEERGIICKGSDLAPSENSMVLLGVK